MAISILDGGSVSRTITAMKAMDGAMLRSIFRAKVMDADGITLRTVATFSPPMSASASGDVSGTASSGSPTTVTTDAVTITPTGGTAPYSYAYTTVTPPSSGTVTANSPTSASSTFSLLVSPDTVQPTILRGTVTDSLGQTATADFNADFSNITI